MAHSKTRIGATFVIDRMRSRLIGRWKRDPSDPDTAAAYGDVTLEFRDDGQLIYVIHEGEKAQMMFLTFEVTDGVLITNQPSTPKEERTLFELTSDGKLVLHYGGGVSSYVRDSEPNSLIQ